MPGASVVVNFLIAIAVFGICTMYLILFSDVAMSLLVPTGGVDEDSIQQSFLATKTFYVILLCIFISPIVIKESLAELKMNTYVIFGGVFSMIAIMATLLITNGSYKSREEAGLVTEAS